MAITGRPPQDAHHHRSGLTVKPCDLRVLFALFVRNPDSKKNKKPEQDAQQERTGPARTDHIPILSQAPHTFDNRSAYELVRV